jgi:uncharacterized protein YmfQ (DUF2313 family)
MGVKIYNAREFTALLQALLPVGKAWTRRTDSNLGKLMAGIAEEFVRIDTRKADLWRELDPRSTSELLPEWEADYGLPDTCSASLANETERRLYLCVKRHNNPGGQSIAYFLKIAAELGYTAITIEETGAHEWTVDGTEYNEQWAEAGLAKCGDKIVEYGDAFLYCLFNMLKPAHTSVVFTSTP